MATLPIYLPQLGQVLGPAIAGGLAAFAASQGAKRPLLPSPIIIGLQELDRRLAIDRSATRYQILTELDGVAQELLGREEARQFIQATGLTLEQARADALARVDLAIGLIGPFQEPTPRFRTTVEAAEWYRTKRDALQLEVDRGDATAGEQLRHNYSYYLGEVARLNRTLFFPPGFVIEEERGFVPIVPPAPVPIDAPPAPAPPVPIDVPAPGGTIVVPGALDVPGLAGGVSQGVITGFGGLLGITAAGLTAAGAQLFRDIGRERHRGTLQSQTTTWLTMLGNVAGNVASVALPLASLQSAQVDDIVNYLSTRIVDTILDGADVPPDPDIGTAPSRAAQLYKNKIRLGVQAHAWAAGMELAAPLKFMGLNQLSAAIADAAGFQRLAFSTIGQVETAAVLLPMQQWAMRKYRAQLPGLVDVATAYSKKELAPGPIPEGFPPRAAFTPADPAEPAANMYEVMSRYGMPDWWIRTASHHLFLDPRMSEIVRMGQYFSPSIDPSTRFPTEFADKWITARPWVLQTSGITRQEWDADWWLHFRIAVGGYAYEDIKVVRETIKRAVVRRDQTLFLDAITRMHREGFIDDDALDPLVREAWGQVRSPEGIETFRGDPIAARIRATKFRTEFEVKNDVKIITLRAMTRGVLSERETDDALADLGMPPLRRRLEIARAKLGLLPGVSLTLPIDGGETAAGSDELAGVQG